MIGADTIAAIGTSVGQAGIGIVRVSGPASMKIARAVFRNCKLEKLDRLVPRYFTFGLIVDPLNDEEKIDEALCVFMPAPRSYTCEDVVEFQTHGGPLVLRRVLSVILQQGARLALPGEFTQRAFLNGRIDLVQAEAVMGIIEAKSATALKNSTMQLTGKLSKNISENRNTLLSVLAEIEAGLDYPEEDIQVVGHDRLIEKLNNVLASIDCLLATAKTGKILREGLRTVIIGRPNVGKSTLLNALLGEERALVTDIPGTTRDSIEEVVNIRGIPLHIIDTAGLRNSDDRIELMGMQRTRDSIGTAGLILFLIDSSEPIQTADINILQSLPAVPVIIVVNKTDLPHIADLSGWKELSQEYPVVALSAKERTGLDTLEQMIEKLVFNETMHLSEESCLDNLRHVDSLSAAKEHLVAALSALQERLPLDCVSIDLRSVLFSLGAITGETVSDEVVREIFAKFCLGK